MLTHSAVLQGAMHLEYKKKRTLISGPLARANLSGEGGQ